MAVFKCKMCGASLTVEDNKTVIKCDFCGSTQTIASSNDDKKTNLYNRANSFRLKNDFDKALAAYNAIIAEYPKEAEAHWGVILCKYGIEYIDDTRTKKKIPTCNRTQYKSIYDDADYKAAIKYSDVIAREVYEEEAKKINAIQQGILEISQKEEPFDIFICFKDTDEFGNRVEDSVIAQDIYDELVAKGYKVFFSRVTLEGKLGTMYEPYIFAALNSAKIMLFVCANQDYMYAPFVKNEWSRFLALMTPQSHKYLIPCFKNMNAYDLPEEMMALQAQDMSKLGWMQDLLRGIDKLMERDTKIKTKQEVKTVIQNGINLDSLITRIELTLEDGDFDKSDELVEKLLDNDPKNAKAYVFKLMIELRVKKESNLSKQNEPFNTSSNYQKALKFASKEYYEVVKGYNDKIVDRIEKEKNESTYIEAEGLLNRNYYDEALALFTKIRNYKDSKVKCEECKTRKKEAADRDVYYKAKHLLPKEITEYNHDHVVWAITLLKNIEHYEDSKELIEIYTKKLEQFKIDQEELAKELEKKRILRNQRIKQFLKFFIPIFAVFLIAFFLTTELFIPMSRYNEAMEYIEKGNYEKAESILKETDGYSDAENQLSLIKANKEFYKGSYEIGIDYVYSIGGTITVNFDGNGGTPEKENLTIGKYEDVDLTQYVKEESDKLGYEFTGWTLTNYSITHDKDKYSTVLNLKANYELITYTISYELNGGTVSGFLVTSYDVHDEIIIPNPTKTGYEFIGWTLSNQNEYHKDLVIEEGSIGNRKYVAKYNANEYTINYDPDGGMLSSNTQTIKYDQSINLAVPTKEGYSFVGWYKDNVLFSETTYKYLNNINLKAKWSANTYDITYDANGGILNFDFIRINFYVDGLLYNYQELIQDEYLVIPSTPTKENHIFRGWFLDKGCTQYYDFQSSINTSFDLYAGWQFVEQYSEPISPELYTSSHWYRVSLSANESPSKYFYVVINKPSLPYYSVCYSIGSVVYKQTLKIEIHNMTTDTMIGQQATVGTSACGQAFTAKAGDVISIKLTRVNLELPSSPNLWFQYFEGTTDPVLNVEQIHSYYSSSIYDVNYTFDNAYELLTPVREGYIFEGWYCNNKKVDSGKWKIANDCTLVANWVPEELEIIYDAKGGVVSSIKQTVRYNETFELLEPTRDGYEFDGWYYQGEKIESGIYTYMTNISLEARWNVITYEIEYELNGGANETNPNEFTYESLDIILSDPVKNGYTFVGWTSSEYLEPTKNVLIQSGSVGNKKFTAHWLVNDYVVRLDVNEGDLLSKDTIVVTFGEEYELPTPTRTGYSFAGWYYNSKIVNSSTWDIYGEDVVLVAEWIADLDTAYIVNHYKENLNSDEYSLFETDNLYGESDSKITPLVKSYEGFTAPNGQNVTILPDGSLVVNYYYTRNSYDISFATNGGNNIETVTLEYEDTLNTSIIPVRSNYTFGGWFTDANQTYVYDGLVGAGDITLYAWWQEESKASNFIYSIESGKITITGNNVSLSSVVIPEYIEDKIVSKIASNAFLNNTYITSLLIPNTITSIEAGALSGCSRIQELNIPVIEVKLLFGEISYSNSYLVDEYYIPNSLKKLHLRYSASHSTGVGIQHMQCLSSIEELIIDEGLSISNEAFLGYINLKKITIPSIDNLFGYYFANNDEYDNELIAENSYGAQGYYVPNSLTTIVIKNGNIPDRAFFELKNVTSIVIGNNAVSIGNLAFAETGITSFSFPESLENIGDQAFENVNLGLVNLPSSLKTIGHHAFYNTSITDVSMGNNVITIGNNAFAKTSQLRNISLSNKLTVLDEYTFYKSGIVSIELPESIVDIRKYALADCANLTSINILASTLQNVDSYAFSNNTALEDFILPLIKTEDTAINSSILSGTNNLKTFEFSNLIFEAKVYNCSYGNLYDTSIEVSNVDYYFNDYVGYGDWGGGSCGYPETSVDYKTLSLPSTLKTITINSTNIPNYSMSYNSNIENVILSNNLVAIGDYAFYNSPLLSDIIFPSSLNTIGEYAFSKTGLASIRIDNNITSVGKGAFENCKDLISVNWNTSFNKNYNFTSSQSKISPLFNGTNIKEFIFGDYVTIVSNYMLYNIASIETIIIGKNIKIIDDYAFYNLSNAIFDFKESDSITEVGDYAFYNTTISSLETFNLLNIIGEYAFSSAQFSDVLVIPDSVTSIGKFAFSNNEVDITKVTLPFIGSDINNANMSSDDEYSFSWIGLSSTVTSVTITNSTQINRLAFSENVIIQEVILPNTVEVIGEKAFYKCSSLTTINLPLNIKSIGENAFNGTSLTSLNIPESIENIGKSSFAKINTFGESLILPFIGSNINDIENGVEYIFTEDLDVRSIASNIKEVTVLKGTIHSLHCLKDIETINIGKDVTYIYPNSFTSSCNWYIGGYYGGTDYSKITNINVDEENSAYSSIDGNVYNKDKTTIIQYALGKTDKSFELPDSVETIGEYAFAHSEYLEELIVTENTKTISDYAFAHSKVNTITNGDNIEYIGDYAFYAGSPYNFVLGDKIKYIGDCAFHSAGINNVFIPLSVEYLGSSAFTCQTLYIEAESAPESWAYDWQYYAVSYINYGAKREDITTE